MRKAKGRRGKGASREAKKKRAAPRKSVRAKLYEYLGHPADVGFVARGKTLEDVFAAAAQAMVAYGWELNRVKARETLEIRARAATLEDLLYSWLSEVLFLADAERWVFKTFAVHKVSAPASPARSGVEGPPTLWEVRATARGERFNKQQHRPRTYVKAVTYHQLAVRETRAGWQATIYLDV